jgi:hypothetical protein
MKGNTMKKTISINIILALIIMSLTAIIIVGNNSIERSDAAIAPSQTLVSGYDAFSNADTFSLTVGGVRGWKVKGWKNNVNEISTKSKTSTNSVIGDTYMYLGDTLKYISFFNWNSYSSQTIRYKYAFVGNSKCKLVTGSTTMSNVTPTQTFKEFKTQKSGSVNMSFKPDSNCVGGYINMWAAVGKKGVSAAIDYRTKIRFYIYNAPTATISVGSFKDKTLSNWNYYKSSWAGSTNKSYPFSDFDTTYSTSNKELECIKATKSCDGLLKTPGVYPIVTKTFIKGTDGGGATYTLASKTFSYNLTVLESSSSTYVQKPGEVSGTLKDKTVIVFTDIDYESSANKNYIKWMANNNFIPYTVVIKKPGIIFAKFKPTSKVSKSTLASIFYKMSSQPFKYKPNYSDTKRLSALEKYAIGWTKKMSIIPKCKAKKFCPASKIKRKQMAEYLRNFVKNPKDTNAGFKPFKDLKKISSSIKKDIYWAYHEGLIGSCKGSLKKNNLKFCPNKKMTKVEITNILYKTANNYLKQKKKKNFTTWWL